MAILLEKLKTIPDKPGVYIMKDSSQTVLYVGKAKNLKKRVKNYFEPGRDGRYSVLLFVPKVDDLEWVITDNEKEAFLLENNLIKKLKPKYNLSLKDDKDFLSIRIDPREDFPKLLFVRRPKNDGALYFGPYSSGSSIKITIKSVGKIFKLRRCSVHVFMNRSRPCILHQIGLCHAPCVGLISKEDYAKIVEGAAAFLKGNVREIVKELKLEMNKASIEMRYEDAVKSRDKIRAIEDAMIEQKVVAKDFKDRDIFGFAREGERVAVSLLTVREGRLLGGKNFKLKSKYLNDGEIISSFVSQYYLNKANYIPREILLPNLIADKTLLENGLSRNDGVSPKVLVPIKGDKSKMVEMAKQNALESLRESLSLEDKTRKLLEFAKVKLHLRDFPARIEGYDISNLQGADATGSMVVFTNGLSDKDSYRKFKIRFASGPDDYSMMNEVLTRRLSNEELGPFPNLIVVDGGKGQLNVASAILEEKSYQSIDLISIAKEKLKRTERVTDRIFIKGRKNPLSLKGDSPVLHLISRVRDEAHRFAVSYHKKLRSKI